MDDIELRFRRDILGWVAVGVAGVSYILGSLNCALGYVGAYRSKCVWFFLRWCYRALCVTVFTRFWR